MGHLYCASLSTHDSVNKMTCSTCNTLDLNILYYNLHCIKHIDNNIIIMNTFINFIMVYLGSVIMVWCISFYSFTEHQYHAVLVHNHESSMLQE